MTGNNPLQGSNNYASAANTDTITQEEIQHLIHLRSQQQRYSDQRQSLRRRLLAGASVEPGPRNLQIARREVLSFSQRTLRVQFGNEYVDQLRGLIEPVTRYEMVVSDISDVSGSEARCPVDF